jgi:hypothetical protein
MWLLVVHSILPNVRCPGTQVVGQRHSCCACAMCAVMESIAPGVHHGGLRHSEQAAGCRGTEHLQQATDCAASATRRRSSVIGWCNPTHLCRRLDSTWHTRQRVVSLTMHHVSQVAWRLVACANLQNLMADNAHNARPLAPAVASFGIRE